jgi:Tfp pilus assembly ATPase PilU
MTQDDLNQLVSELNRAVVPLERFPVRPDDASVVASWLAAVRRADGSDLLLVTGTPPAVRAHGTLVRLPGALLDSEDIETAVRPLVAPALWQRYQERGAIDLAFTHCSISTRRSPSRARRDRSRSRNRSPAGCRRARSNAATPCCVRRIPTSSHHC